MLSSRCLALVHAHRAPSTVKASAQEARLVSGRSAVWVIAALTWALASGCAGGSAVKDDGTVQSDVANYQIKAPEGGWSEVSVGDSDAAWVHETLHATLMVNALCEGVDDAPLTALTNHLLFGTTDREFVAQEEVMVSRRAALESTVNFKLDGVPRRMKALVMKKDGCVYDIVYAAPPESFEKGLAGYVSLRSNFDVKARP